MRYTFGLAVFAVSLLAACNNTPALPTTAPTIAATTAPQVAATTASTQAPTATNTRGARELPPTWTPTPPPTQTPTPTEVIATQTPFAPAAALPAECNGFDIIFAESTQTFQIGTAPKVAWKPVPTAVRYRVELGDINGRTVANEIFVAETNYTFDASLFSTDSPIYTWSVYPINQAGDQMCFEVGGEMTPSLTAPGAGQ
jgi:hypothetical protein